MSKSECILIAQARTTCGSRSRDPSAPLHLPRKRLSLREDYVEILKKLPKRSLHDLAQHFPGILVKIQVKSPLVHLFLKYRSEILLTSSKRSLPDLVHLVRRPGRSWWTPLQEVLA